MNQRKMANPRYNDVENLRWVSRSRSKLGWGEWDTDNMMCHITENDYTTLCGRRIGTEENGWFFESKGWKVNDKEVNTDDWNRVDSNICLRCKRKYEVGK